jgi:ABC-2 type transport system ATP-binding protein
MTHGIEFDGLSVRFGSRQVLHDLHAALRGRAVGLLGPNGAGKTTLLQTILGFVRPASGTVRIHGKDVLREGHALRAEIGYMPESEAFVAGMTAVRFVRMMAELSGLPPDAALERAHETLQWVGLGEARYRKLETFSLGMKQLAKLAQAIVHAPGLLFLDEPTSGLDPPARERMLRLIAEIRDSGKTQVVVSSHLLRDVEQVCEEVLVLREGRIAVQCDLLAERRTDRKFLTVETAGDGRAFADAAERLGVTCAIVSDGKLKMVLPESLDVAVLFRLAAEQGLPIRRLDARRDSLEDIFLRAMEGTDAHP